VYDKTTVDPFTPDKQVLEHEGQIKGGKKCFQDTLIIPTSLIMYC
jgi:hypothetical protein